MVMMEISVVGALSQSVSVMMLASRGILGTKFFRDIKVSVNREAGSDLVFVKFNYGGSATFVINVANDGG